MWIVVRALALSGAENELNFERTRIPDTTYEACSVFDVNRVGDWDIVSDEYLVSGTRFFR